MAKIESENDGDANSEDELGDAFAALLAGIIEEETEETGEQHSDSYFTSIEGFFSTKSYPPNKTNLRIALRIVLPLKPPNLGMTYTSFIKLLST
jgi:hypothetical protein